MKTLKTLKLSIPAIFAIAALTGCARDWHYSATTAQLTKDGSKLNDEVQWCQAQHARGRDVNKVPGCVAAGNALQAAANTAAKRWVTAKPIKPPM